MPPNRVSLILPHDHSMNSAVIDDMICKDLGYVQSLARSQVFPAPLTSLVHEIFMAGRAAGEGKRSQAAIVKLWER